MKTVAIKRADNAHENTEPPFVTSEGGGSLALACNALTIDGVELLIRRTRDGWEATFLLPDGEELRSETENTVHDALWRLVRGDV